MPTRTSGQNSHYAAAARRDRCGEPRRALPARFPVCTGFGQHWKGRRRSESTVPPRTVPPCTVPPCKVPSRTLPSRTLPHSGLAEAPRRPRREAPETAEACRGARPVINRRGVKYAIFWTLGARKLVFNTFVRNGNGGRVGCNSEDPPSRLAAGRTRRRPRTT